MAKRQVRIIPCTTYVTLKNGEVWKCEDLPEWKEVWRGINDRCLRAEGYVPESELQEVAP